MKENEIYICVAENVYGPLTHDELRNAIRNKIINNTTLVCPTEDGDFVPLEESFAKQYLDAQIENEQIERIESNCFDTTAANLDSVDGAEDNNADSNESTGEKDGIKNSVSPKNIVSSPPQSSSPITSSDQNLEFRPLKNREKHIVASGGRINKKSGEIESVSSLDDIKPYHPNEIGKVKKYDHFKGFGFIAIDGKPDVHFHQRSLASQKQRNINESVVEIKVGKSLDGRITALEVVILSNPNENKSINDYTLEELQKFNADGQNEIKNLLQKLRHPRFLLTNWASIQLKPRNRQIDRDYDNCLPKLGEISLKEDWYFKYDNNSPSEADLYSILRNYIIYTFYRVAIEGKVAFSPEFAVFNTGLVDRIYEPIYALFSRTPNASKMFNFVEFCVVNSKKSGKILMEQFAPAMRPQPAQYVSSIGEVVFDAECAISSQWNHVIEDAIADNRYPLEFLEEHCPRGFNFEEESKSARTRADFIKSYLKHLADDQSTRRTIKVRLDAAIELAKKRARWNYKAAIPHYFPTLNEMSLLLPIALLDDEHPDMALVVKKVNSGEYSGVTIFPLDMAYKCARLVCRPDSDWLTTDIDKRSNSFEDAI